MRRKRTASEQAEAVNLHKGALTKRELREVFAWAEDHEEDDALAWAYLRLCGAIGALDDNEGKFARRLWELRPGAAGHNLAWGFPAAAKRLRDKLGALIADECLGRTQ